MPFAHLAADVRDLAVGLYQRGWKPKDISALLGPSERSIGRWTKPADYVPTRKMSPRGKRVQVTCPECGRQHYMYPSAAKRGRRFCSRTCASMHPSKHKRGPAHHRYARVVSVCLECGKEFEHIPSKRRMFCSHECASTWSGRIRRGNGAQKGPRNPNWKGGATEPVRRLRASREYAEWRRTVFGRDGYRCARCGAKDQYLHAHHVVPVSEHPDLALVVSNGTTLCAACHQYMHPELHLSLAPRKGQ